MSLEISDLRLKAEGILWAVSYACVSRHTHRSASGGAEKHGAGESDLRTGTENRTTEDSELKNGGEGEVTAFLSLTPGSRRLG